VLLFLAVPALLAQPSAPAPEYAAQPCAVPEQKQLEFWVGDWDLTWPGEKQGELDHGTHVHRLLGQLRRAREFFRRQGHAPARISVSIFDTRARKWKQTWVDNEGGYLDLSVNSRWSDDSDGAMVCDRMGPRLPSVWCSRTSRRMSLDWNWEASTDGGKSWQVTWPIHYRGRALNTA